MDKLTDPNEPFHRRERAVLVEAVEHSKAEAADARELLKSYRPGRVFAVGAVLGFMCCALGIFVVSEKSRGVDDVPWVTVSNDAARNYSAGYEAGERSCAISAMDAWDRGYTAAQIDCLHFDNTTPATVSKPAQTNGRILFWDDGSATVSSSAGGR